MIDVSDGLLQDVGHIAGQSGVTIDIRAGAFTLADPLLAVGAALGVDPVTFVLTGGDDYGLVACFPPEVKLPSDWLVIGEVTGKAADAAVATAGEPAVGGSIDEPALVTVDGAVPELPRGHQHFR